MSIRNRATLVACVALPLAGAGAYLHFKGGDAGVVAMQPTAAASRALQVPMGFEANRGQIDDRVDYLARGPGYSLFLTASEAVFSLVAPSAQASQSTVLRLSLIGANKAPVATGVDKQAGVSHYLTGAQATRNVERFGKVRYAGVYPGIDVVYYGNQHELEYDFIVAPGADPKRIGLRFGGTNAVKLDASGNLVLSTAGGDVVQHKPIAYQTIDGQRRAVDSRYRVSADNSVAFEVGAYDRGHALVIDPVVVYRAPFDGNGNDTTTRIVVDAEGNAYVTGTTDSTDFPATQDAPQARNAGYTDVFIAKINAAGNAFVWNTYLGGGGGEQARGIGVDADGNVVVAGVTTSVDFPTVAAIQPSHAGGGQDGFVARLTADGSALIYSTHLGSPGFENVSEVAVGADGSAYVNGSSNSALFPRTRTGLCSVGVENAGCDFVTKLDPEGAIAYSVMTYYAGSAIAVDASGTAYTGGANTVTRLAPDGALEKIKTISAGGNFQLADIAVGKDGAVYAVGAEATAFAAAINSDLTLNTGSAACKIDPTFASLVYCAHVGVAKTNHLVTQTLTGIAVDEDGGVVVTGTNNRGDAGLATDAFVQGITPSGRSQRFLQSVGRARADATQQSGVALALDQAGNMYVTGNGTGSSFVVRMAPADWKIVGAGDSDGDGRADLFWHNRDIEQFHTWSMQGATRTAVRSAAIPRQFRVAARADFNGDGRTDVLWVDATSVWIWQAEANGTFSAHFVADHPQDGWDIAGAGDVDGDHRADILWHNRQLEELDWWLMDGARPRAFGGQYVPARYSVAQVADFTGDGRDDLVWQDDARTTLWLWEADVSDFAIRYIDAYPPAGWNIVGAGDIDGDHRADLMWHNVALQQLAWWTMHGAARVATNGKYIPAMYRVDAVGDFDGDHRTDIVWRDDDRTSLWMWRAVPNDFAIQFIDAYPANPR